MKPKADPITLTIAFEGLMLFQTGPRKIQLVAIADARHCHGHVPKIDIYREADWAKKKTVPLANGDLVTFTVDPEEVTHDGFYDDRVPKLLDYVIAGGVELNKALALVMLPPGELTTWGGFEYKVQLTKKGDSEEKCFARFVVLKTTVATHVTMSITHLMNPIDLDPRDLVVVSNASDDKTHAHFPAYAKLLTQDGQIGDSKILWTTCVALGVGQFQEKRPEIERLLKALNAAGKPERGPNSDCGPTGP